MAGGSVFIVNPEVRNLMAKNYTVTVTLQAKDRLSKEVKGLTKDVEHLSKGLRPLGGMFGKLEGQLRQIGRNNGLARLNRDASSAVITLRNTLGDIPGLWQAVAVGSAGMIAKGFIDTAAKFETIRNQLKGLYGDDGPKMLAWAERFAIDTPMELEGVVAAMRRLKASGVDPTAGALQSIVDQVTKMGGSTEALEGAVVAISQMYAKGKISAEEMNQLAERGVMGWSLLAKATGKTQQELMKMGEGGKLTKQYIDQLVKAMGQDAKGAASAASRSWTGIMSSLGDIWGSIRRRIMDGGAFDSLKDKLLEVFDALNTASADPKFQATLTTIGASVAGLIDWIWKAGKQLAPLFEGIFKGLKPLIDQVGQSFAPMFSEVSKAINTIVGKMGGWKAVGETIGGVLSVLVGWFLRIPLIIAFIVTKLAQLYNNNETVRRSVNAVLGLFKAIVDNIVKAVGWVSQLILKLNGLQGKKKVVVSVEQQQTFKRIMKGNNVTSPIDFLPARASGGPVTSRRPYLVGEKGPEVFTPGVSGFIQPNGFLKAMAGGVQAVAQGKPLEVFINIDLKDGRPIVQTKTNQLATVHTSFNQPYGRTR